MRIIGGEFGSRIIKNTKSRRTHPMSEKIRGAIFNSIGDITGLTVLDAFAGTGAVGIEALSRGAQLVHAVEMNADSFETLKENRDLITDTERMQVHRANVGSWLKNQQKYFDLIIADPPYDSIGMRALDACANYVEIGGMLVLSVPPAEHITFDNLRKIDEKRYGNAKIVFFRRMK